MPPALRRFAWSSFFLTQAALVLAATAYVGVGTRGFWLVLAAAAVASVAYALVVRRTPEPELGETASAPQRWYWF
jgi:hypothetical protein